MSSSYLLPIWGATGNGGGKGGECWIADQRLYYVFGLCKLLDVNSTLFIAWGVSPATDRWQDAVYGPGYDESAGPSRKPAGATKRKPDAAAGAAASGIDYRVSHFCLRP